MKKYASMIVLILFMISIAILFIGAAMHDYILIGLGGLFTIIIYISAIRYFKKIIKTKPQSI